LQSRGAEIYAEFLGGSFTCDAYHMTEPHPDGMWGLQPFLSQLHSSWFYSSAHDSRTSEGFSEIIFQQHYLGLYSAICQGHFKAPVAEDSYCFDKSDVWLGTLLMLQASPVFFANLISELCVFFVLSGAGVVLCIEKALTQAGVSRHNVNYVNAHATSTRAGDLQEYKALMRSFGKNTEVGINLVSKIWIARTCHEILLLFWMYPSFGPTFQHGPGQGCT
jgi:3-oxoacyl-(acyl-carrier-protein) synthase